MVFVSDIIPNPMSAFSEEGTAGRSQGKCSRRDSVRCEDGLSKTLTFWVARCGTELKSRPSPRFCVKYPSSAVSTVGKHEEMSLSLGQQRLQKEHWQLGHS